MIKLPEHIAEQMKQWRAGFGWNVPEAYIDFHMRTATASLKQLAELEGWDVLKQEMTDDGWCDGMKVVTAVIETKNGELKRIKWHTQGTWMEKMSGGGWGLFHRGLLNNPLYS